MLQGSTAPPAGWPGAAPLGLHLQRAMSAPASPGGLPPLQDEQALRARLRQQQQELQRQREEQDAWAAKARAVLAQRSGAGVDGASADTASSEQAQAASSTSLLALNGLIVRLHAEIADLAAKDLQYQVQLAAEVAKQQDQQAPPPCRQQGARLPQVPGDSMASAAAPDVPSWEERRALELQAWEARQQRARKRQGRLQQGEEGRAQRAWRQEELLLHQAALALAGVHAASPVRSSAPARMEAEPHGYQPPPAGLLPAAPSQGAAPEVGPASGRGSCCGLGWARPPAHRWAWQIGDMLCKQASLPLQAPHHPTGQAGCRPRCTCTCTPPPPLPSHHPSRAVHLQLPTQPAPPAATELQHEPGPTSTAGPLKGEEQCSCSLWLPHADSCRGKSALAQSYAVPSPS